MISRYLRSPYDPENSRNFWGFVVSRTIANPPRSGFVRWFAWMLALTFMCVATLGIVFGDGLTQLVWLPFGLVGVAIVLPLRSRTTR